MTIENIIIVGGGYAGVKIAQTLEKKLVGNNNYRIILIDKKSYFYHIVGGPRSAIEHINNIIPYSHTFKDMKKNAVHQSTVVRLEKNKVYLDKPFENSIELPFAYAVLSTGIRYPTPAKTKALEADTALAEQREIQSLVKKANSILIVGGGPTGIEVAGEIREKYADKKITLIHSQKQLLQFGIPDKPRAQILHKVEKNDIRVILDDVVELSNELIGKSVFVPQEPITTHKGQKLGSVDLVMLLFGSRPETEWLKDTLPLSDNGFVKVKKTLAVDKEGFENVYIAGDIADIKEIKMAMKTQGHSVVVATNIFDATKGKKPSKIYKPNTTFLMGISFGKKQGYIFTPLGALGDWATSKLKGKTLFTDRTWQDMNLTEPTTTNTSKNVLSNEKVFSTTSLTIITILTLGVVVLGIYYTTTTTA